MSFSDASALVPLVFPEALSPQLQREAELHPDITVWWGTAVECYSAIERRLRLRELTRPAAGRAETKLEQARFSWQEIEPSLEIRNAVLFLRRHALSAADALQLAAAYAFSEGDPPTLEFVSLDSRLVAAARREGFRILDLG